MAKNITKITKEEINNWLMVDELPIIFEDGTSIQYRPDYEEEEVKPFEIWENWDEDKEIGFYNDIEPLYDFVEKKLSENIAILAIENWEM